MFIFSNAFLSSLLNLKGFRWINKAHGLFKSVHNDHIIMWDKAYSMIAKAHYYCNANEVLLFITIILLTGET